MRRRTTLAALAAGMLLALQANPAAAQDFPAKQVRIVVPFPPGGSTDVVARILAQRLSDEYGQQVLVENRPGAGGGLGTQAVAKSEPDGHSLVLVPAGPVTVIPHVNKNIGYALADLVPVAIVFRSPFLLVVDADSPYKTLGELLERGKPGNGEPLAYGSSGNGAASHLGSEMLNAAAGTKFLHVPYKGTPGTLQALFAGDVAWGLAVGNDVKGHLEAGKLRALALMSQQRSALFPDVPAMAELGMKDLDLDVWFGLFAPAKIPPATLDRLNATVKRLIAEPDFVERMRGFGGSVPVDANTPDFIMQRLRKESEVNRKLVESIGVKVN